jgi:hypothetical protein
MIDPHTTYREMLARLAEAERLAKQLTRAVREMHEPVSNAVAAREGRVLARRTDGPWSVRADESWGRQRTREPMVLPTLPTFPRTQTA